MRKTASRRGVAKPNPLLVLLDSTHLLKTILFFGLGSSATKKDASVLGSPRLLLFLLYKILNVLQLLKRSKPLATSTRDKYFLE